VDLVQRDLRKSRSVRARRGIRWLLGLAALLACGGTDAAHAGGAPPPLSPLWMAAKAAARSGATPSGTTSGTAGLAAGAAIPAGSLANVQQSINDLEATARAIVQAQAAQAQAAQAAAAAPRTTVPNGLVSGGLQVDPRALVDPATFWQGADMPTQNVAGGQTTVTVQQTQAQAVLNWQTFNIGASTALNFDQSAGGGSASTWSVLNRVNDPAAQPSTILGAITAPGQVLVLNRNGIIFGAGSQINVNTLIASTADIADTQYLGAQGIYGAIISSAIGTTPEVVASTFTGASGDVIVQDGAEITTDAPASPLDRGGFVLLMGGAVQNNGAITTPNGQTILAAGQDFGLATGYAGGTDTTNAPLGTVVTVNNAGTTSGAVGNTGLIQAVTGDVTLVGHAVTQAGVIYATTSVNQRGSVHLQTDPSDITSSVTLAPGSVTAIMLDTGGATNIEAQRAAYRSEDIEQSLIDITTGGSVSFASGSLTLATGGQLAVTAYGSIQASAGAVLDTAGSLAAVLPASADTLEIVGVQGNDLRDAPVNRDAGNLINQDVYIAIRQLVSVTTDPTSPYYGLLYTPGGLLEVSGYLGNVGHTIQEWAASGGAIILSGTQIAAQPGSVFNIAGGAIGYQAGYVPTTWLTGSDGRLYNVNTAPSTITYSGIYNGFTVSQPRWGITDTYTDPLIAPAQLYQSAYTVGRDAGALTLSAPTIAFQGQIDAGVVTGTQQNGARSADPNLADPYLQLQTTVPLPGTLVVQTLNTPASLTLVALSDLVAAPVVIDNSSQPGASDTVTLPADVIDAAGLGGLSITTAGSIAIDAPVALATGGQVSLIAPNVQIAAPLTARAGGVSITNQISILGSPTVLAATTTATIDIGLAANAAIDTRGVFTNLLSDPGAVAGEAFVNGGPVTIDSSQAVDLQPGSVIDASSGGVVLANAGALGGKGGAISITAYDPSVDTNQKLSGTPLTIAATLLSVGSISGGAFTLSVPSVLISDSAPPGQPGPFVLPSSFFASGFSRYTISGPGCVGDTSCAGGVTVADNTQVSVVEPVYEFTSAMLTAPTGSDPASVFDLELPPLFLPNPATARLTQRQGASLALLSPYSGAGLVDPGTSLATNPITVGANASIAVDPLQSVTVSGFGQITVDGSIAAPGGAISVLNTRQSGSTLAFPTVDGQCTLTDCQGMQQLSVWLGGASVLDVAAQAAVALDAAGRPYGSVPGGGTITLGSTGAATATDAYVVIRPGALLRAGGTAASIDQLAGTGSAVSVGSASLPTLVASSGGAINITSASGVYLDGSLAAPSGGAGAPGGSLGVDLATPNYDPAGNDPTDASIIATTQNPRIVTIGQTTLVSALPADLQPGTANSPFVFGSARLSSQQIGAGGFDSLAIASGDSIAFDGNVAIAVGRGISLTTAYIQTLQSGTNVSLTAPTITLNGVGTPGYVAGSIYQQTSSVFAKPVGLPTTATLSLDAAQIDIAGTLQLGADFTYTPRTAVGASLPPQAVDFRGFAQAILASGGDIVIGQSAGAASALAATGNLVLTAAQIYPVGNATISAADTLAIASNPGAPPPPPLISDGSLTLIGTSIEQGGVLRAPGGQITLGNPAGGTAAVEFLPGSITSVSSFGWTIPDAGTAPQVPGITIDTLAATIDSSATLDLRGGGTLAQASFIYGRGGSADVRTAPLLTLSASGTVTAPSSSAVSVFAILPGGDGQAAPAGGTAIGTGSSPGIGDRITIAAGVPGLPAGTYTLLPGADALLPGAFLVNLNPTAHTLLQGALALGNGSYKLNAYAGIANTGDVAALPVTITVSSGAAVRDYADYNEQTASQTELALAALSPGTPHTTVTEDARQLTINLSTPTLPAGPQLIVQPGTILLQPAPGGYGATATVSAPNGNLEITPNGAAPTPGYASVPAAALDAIGTETLSIGGAANNSLAFVGGTSAVSTNNVVLRSGATLSAAQVFLVAYTGGVTVEQGASIDTIGQGIPLIEAANAIAYTYQDVAVLGVSNGAITVAPQPGAVQVTTPAIAVGAVCQNPVCGGPASLYTTGTIAFATSGNANLDSSTLYGAADIYLTVPSVNIAASQAALAGYVVPPGLTLTQNVLQGLLAGNPAIGTPPLQVLNLTAAQSVDFYGSVNLDATDPTTGQATVALAFSTPAFYGAGGPGDAVNLTAGTLVLNGVSVINPNAPAGTQINAAGYLVSATPGALMTGGAGTGTGSFTVNANQIVLGFAAGDSTATNEVTLDRIIRGFATVTLAGNTEITGNNAGSLTVYGDLNLVTPLLTAAPGSVSAITATGALAISAPPGGPATGPADALGAEIDLTAASIVNSTAIVLPSGRLTMNATNDITLASGSRIDLSGQPVSLFDQTNYGWGGNVVLQSSAGDVTQLPGASIDVSASGNDAGSLTISATGAGAGVVTLDGGIQGGATGGFSSGQFVVSAQSLDFDAVNAMLDQGQVFGERSFDIMTGDLTIDGAVTAQTVNISVDSGSLAVSGTINASGAVPGSITLSARNGLAIAGTALLDAHATTLQVDSTGQPIPAENVANVVLTTSAPGSVLTLAPGATIDLASPDDVARGTLVLNAPRAGGNDLGITAAGPVTISGAASIAAYGFQTYTPLDAAGTVTQATLDAANLDSIAFIDAANANPALAVRLAGLTAAGGGVFHLRPGVEIDSCTAANAGCADPNGALTVSGDLNLAGYRYGPAGYQYGLVASGNGSGEPGALVLRAAGNLDVFGSVTDGFAAPPANNPDNAGWQLLAGLEPNGANVVLPTPITLLAGTQFLTGANGFTSSNLALTYPITINGGTSTVPVSFATATTAPVTLASAIQINASARAPTTTTATITEPSGTVIAAGTVITRNTGLPVGTVLGTGTVLTSISGKPTAAVIAPVSLNPNVVLPAAMVLGAATPSIAAGTVLTASVYPAGTPLAAAVPGGATPLYAMGTVLASNVVLPTGSVLGAGSTLPVAISIAGNTVWPAGAPLSGFTAPLTLGAAASLPAGSLIPANTSLVLGAASSPVAGACTASACDLTAASGGVIGGTVWAVAPLLPAGSLSWSLNLVAGADLSAADSHTMQAPAALAASASASNPTPGSITLSDPHYSGGSLTTPGISVLRTGTGDLNLLAGGSIAEASLYGIYTAGTQTPSPVPLAAGQTDPFNLPRALSADGSTVLTATGAGYESLVTGGNYQANYPDSGGNVLVSAQANIAGDILAPLVDSLPASDGVANWLWRQGATANGVAAAWWINYGTYTTFADTANGQAAIAEPILTGFTGIGALGGGNVTVLAGGNAGAMTAAAVTANYAQSQGLDVAVASTGRVVNGSTVLTGGGDITVRVAGALNGNGTVVGNNQLNGTLTDLRGSISVIAGAIGQVDVTPPVTANITTSAGITESTTPTAFAQGGPTVVPGDATVSLSAMRDLVLGGAGDATRLVPQNTTTLTTASGPATIQSWFSLWQPGTAIDLLSAGGNVTPSTQLDVSGGNLAAYANSPPTEGISTTRFIYPATLLVDAASGNIFIGGSLALPATAVSSAIELAPSPIGQLQLLAAQSIIVNARSSQAIDISGANPALLPTPLDVAFSAATGNATNISAGSIGPTNIDLTNLANILPGTSLFAFEADDAIAGLHAADANPALIYAGTDISGLRLGELLTDTAATPVLLHIAAKPALIKAGQDIIGPAAGAADPSLILNANPTDVSVLSAGRDINTVNVDIAGPGLLYVQAGRNINQATSGVLESLGPLVPDAQTRAGGAGITVLAGVGQAGPDWTGFADLYLNPANQALVAQNYAPQLLAFLQTTYGYQGSQSDALAFFESLSVPQQSSFLLTVYFDELRASGREFTNPASPRAHSYARGRQAIATLFPASASYAGDVNLAPIATSLVTPNAGIRTDFGGDINLLVPGGATTLGVGTVLPGAIAGVLTQGQGNVNIYSLSSVALGLSRVFTTFGGGITIWSATGDINAGRGSKSTDVFSPSSILYDSLGNVSQVPSVPTTGAGIATLAPIAGVAAGDVDLVTPLGTIDAGEAGIRVSGNVNLAALHVVNAANVQVGGKSAGLASVSAPNVAAEAAASSAASASGQSGQQNAGAASSGTRDVASIITVEVTGFGEGCTAPASPSDTPRPGC
jgi:filamentous hemagglutinin family protein